MIHGSNQAWLLLVLFASRANSGMTTNCHDVRMDLDSVNNMSYAMRRITWTSTSFTSLNDCTEVCMGRHCSQAELSY
jgi:hypothetical protein